MLMPWSLKACDMLVLPNATPMLPVMVPGWATILVAGAAKYNTALYNNLMHVQLQTSTCGSLNTVCQVRWYVALMSQCRDDIDIAYSVVLTSSSGLSNCNLQMLFQMLHA